MMIAGGGRNASRALAPIAMFAAALLEGCNSNSVPFETPTALSAAPNPAGRDDSRMSNETFASKDASSSCTGQGSVITGSFHASGIASGPFPGTFTLRGHLSVGLQSLDFHEHFRIVSGSHLISGSATIPDSSGSPVFGCSKRGVLSFYATNLTYETKKPHASGSGYASLSGKQFGETFF
jgi:hypothetical protein